MTDIVMWYAFSLQQRIFSEISAAAILLRIMPIYVVCVLRMMLFVVQCAYRTFLDQFSSLVRACITKLQLILKQYKEIANKLSVSCHINDIIIHIVEDLDLVALQGVLPRLFRAAFHHL